MISVDALSAHLFDDVFDASRGANSRICINPAEALSERYVAISHMIFRIYANSRVCAPKSVISVIERLRTERKQTDVRSVLSIQTAVAASLRFDLLP